jgi:hypothetical protein
LLLPGPFAAPVRLVAMAFSSEVVAGSRQNKELEPRLWNHEEKAT